MWRPRALAPLLVLSAIAASANANASDKDLCADAYEAAQRHRHKGQLRASRRNLLVCARATCGSILATDCTAWLPEVEAALPTVVPAVRDQSGHDLVQVRVLVDGELIASSLGGTAIEVDPGVHTFRFESAGATIERSVLVREGEKHRLISVVMNATSSRTAQTEVADSSRMSSTVLVFGGIGGGRVLRGNRVAATQPTRRLQAELRTECSRPSKRQVLNRRYPCGIGTILSCHGRVLLYKSLRIYG